jgi:hypothetical protein
MFGLKPKLPVTDEERLWVEDGFRRLGRMLGWSRMQNARVILPTDEFFPDAYEPDESGLRALFLRVCGYMGVNPSGVELDIFPDSSEHLEDLPAYSYRSNDAAGLHFGADEGALPLVAVKSSLLKDPLAMVATIAHELGHVILLGGGHMSRGAEDMEPMTDLVAIYLGLGVFTANSARRFQQFQDDRRQGWSMKHLGYLPETVFGYALAWFARLRDEARPPWVAHLNTNLKVYFRQSTEWLRQQTAPIQ